jgi:hypothetical protein
MLKTADRDLLVISKQALESEDALQEEVGLLNELLHEVEVLQNIACSAEIFDLNRYRTISKPANVAKQLKEKNFRPFVFICNRN